MYSDTLSKSKILKVQIKGKMSIYLGRCVMEYTHIYMHMAFIHISWYSVTQILEMAFQSIKMSFAH
jgi:hypothetical protein